MARGIIVNIGSGGSPPKLVIADFDASKRALYVPGDILEFTSQIPIKEGFLVEGDIPDQGDKLVLNVTSVLDNNPTIVTGNVSGNTTVGANQVYYITNTGQITGNVSVNGGVLFVVGGKANGNISIGSNSAIIAGNGATIGGGTFEVIGSGNNAIVAMKACTINGKFATSGITFVNLGGNTFNGGNVSSNGDEYVTIKDNTVNNGKDLTVSAVVIECKISGNTVTGSTSIDPKCTA